MCYMEDLVRDGPSLRAGIQTRAQSWTGEAGERVGRGEDVTCQKVVQAISDAVQKQQL